ncbi:MAG: Fic family protein [Clostridia bacterium]|nr:Fic family protein [Clostridia bacterium]
MKYLSVKEIAKKWKVSERTVRNYCALGKIKGAFLTGKTWNIPETSLKPNKTKEIQKTDNELLNILRNEKESNLKGGIYHKTQINLCYNSNRIEGSKLTENETRFIFETNTLGIESKVVNIDDIIESANHFKCFDFILENAMETLSEKMIKEIHFMLKMGTLDSRKDWFVVGGYKKLPNEVGGNETTSPKEVPAEMKKLLVKYNSLKKKDFEKIIEFHKDFESIHPFQDGNGRIGRLIMFKECLANNVVPFIITDEKKYFYYRGLKEWNKEKGFLIDNCLLAQDEYKKYLDYFGVKY